MTIGIVSELRTNVRFSITQKFVSDNYGIISKCGIKLRYTIFVTVWNSLSTLAELPGRMARETRTGTCAVS